MVLSGLDMVGIAQTGSGKTLAVSSNVLYILVTVLHVMLTMTVVCTPSIGTHSCPTSSEAWRRTDSMSTIYIISTKHYVVFSLTVSSGSSY